MSRRNEYSGFAIALAWPATYCKEPGSWYDPVTRWLGISHNNYYRAGHAALVLIDREELKCHYFDFGRYHAPFQHGRVRDAVTDHDLKMHTEPRISTDGRSIENLDEILSELQHNAACHGEGPLHASYTRIDFALASDKVLAMQETGPIPYGPFVPGGSNCSRFVHTALMAGKPGWNNRFRLKFFMPFTPTPLSNVHALHHKKVVPVLRESVPFFPARPLGRDELGTTLPVPVRHPDIPGDAQWLSGEGAGSWFSLRFRDVFLIVTRYAPDGKEECKGMYQETVGGGGKMNSSLLRQNKAGYLLDYPSNCKEVTLIHQGVRLRFERTVLERKMRMDRYPVMAN
ncbi:MAG: hypothetical protein P1P82_03250 [Bacteroidales bacterium]|nr:hypothetical protein [Bacteroidales bacterium]MDT8430110.1 DUF6695 family protein [Bacteroidales bacterium]